MTETFAGMVTPVPPAPLIRLEPPGCHTIPPPAPEAALTAFTSRLQRTGSKLLFVATTPEMQQEWYGNLGVPALNAVARRVMGAAGVPYADLYAHITARCGERYYTCDICDDESAGWPPGAPPGATCGAHYTAAGYAYIVDFLAPIVAGLL